MLVDDARRGAFHLKESRTGNPWEIMDRHSLLQVLQVSGQREIMDRRRIHGQAHIVPFFYASTKGARQPCVLNEGNHGRHRFEGNHGQAQIDP